MSQIAQSPVSAVVVREHVRIARQGDVLVERIDALPEGVVPAPRDALGRVVLAYGESHGHAHAFRDPVVCGFRLAGTEDVDWVEVGGAGATLTHEFASGEQADHEPVALEPGVYRVRRQREYDPFQDRRALD
jgi:hypothetical protein